MDPTAWRNEVERVSTKLKTAASGGSGASNSITAGANTTGREWRSHLEQTVAAEGIILSTLPSTRYSLEGLAGTQGDRSLIHLQQQHHALAITCVRASLISPLSTAHMLMRVVVAWFI